MLASPGHPVFAELYKVTGCYCHAEKKGYVYRLDSHEHADFMNYEVNALTKIRIMI